MVRNFKPWAQYKFIENQKILKKYNKHKIKKGKR